MNIGIFCIATAKYKQFVDPFVKSTKHFFPENSVYICLFTDRISECLYTNLKFSETFKYHFYHNYNAKMVLEIPIEHKPWPLITLERYHTFCNNKEKLDILNLDYVYYCDIDALFADTVSNELIPKNKDEIVVVRHPGFFRGGGTWEERPESACCVPPSVSKDLQYYAGGFNGGAYETFMKMAETIRDWINEDGEKGIIPLWHDESALQKYVVDKPKHILSPSYCYPEELTLPFEKKLLVLRKNHAEFRNV